MPRLPRFKVSNDAAVMWMIWILAIVFGAAIALPREMAQVVIAIGSVVALVIWTLTIGTARDEGQK